MPNFDRRLTTLERRLHVGLPRLIIIEGGLTDEMTFATSGERRWERQAGEPLDVFETRVLAHAAQARLPFVVIGGIGPIGRVEPPAYAPGAQDID